VVRAGEHVREEDLLAAIERGGGVEVELWLACGNKARSQIVA
jgi:hypothetical protein